MPNTTEKLKNKDDLDNSYVKDYYNKQVGSFNETYETVRWHTTPSQEFEYNQTSRAIESSLSGFTCKTALEIGPGDGVWTKKLRKHVDGNIHLVEQSSEMFEQAKENLKDIESLTFENADFMESLDGGKRDLIFASRCFEYFDQKSLSLKKMFDLLNPNGRLIIITKNSKLLTSKSAQGKTLHSDQLSKEQMRAMLVENGFKIERIYPAVMRWKTKYMLMRVVFDLLHRVAVWSNGFLRIPFVYTHATESFVYVANKPSNS